MKYALVIVVASILFVGCSKKDDHVASGHFEADEVIVSSQQNGQLIDYKVEEGIQLSAGDLVGQVDVQLAKLQKEQVEASIASLIQKTSNTQQQDALVLKQLAVLDAQLSQLMRERNRTANLVKADAATQKQLDDIDASIIQLNRQMDATRQQVAVNNSNSSTQNRSILSEKEPMEKSVAVMQEQIKRGQVVNPITGTVLVNYALKGEMQTVGKPLYKIASLDTLYLRAYITGTQLAEVKIGQRVTIRIDKGKDSYQRHNGTVAWISGKSEFSPKTIQTKDERANLVYAIKVKVKNDGYLKIGMYGEVIF